MRMMSFYLPSSLFVTLLICSVVCNLVLGICPPSDSCSYWASTYGIGIRDSFTTSRTRTIGRSGSTTCERNIETKGSKSRDASQCSIETILFHRPICYTGRAKESICSMGWNWRLLVDLVSIVILFCCLLPVVSIVVVTGSTSLFGFDWSNP